MAREAEDDLEFEDFEDSGSEYVPLEDDSQETDTARTKNKTFYLKIETKKNTVNQIWVDDSEPG